MRSSIPQLLCGAALAVALAGCGERSLQTPAPDGGSTVTGDGSPGRGDGGGSGGPGDAGDQDAVPGPCDVPMGARVYIDDPASIMAVLPGRWVRCGHALMSNESEVGILIGADYRFAVLLAGADGTATPSTSLLETGEVLVNPLGTFNGHLSFDLDFIVDANIDYQTSPFFTNGMPLQLVTTNTDIFWLRYVRVDP